ncbi:hypothetical protein Tsubulata_024019 [Turnera subulata]|uniref:Uncharacterized protein n=1 Tax=Turnera subulata TaxID=218843 RepID=A0A9Q0GK89_9ROSI|nr:hypothetical protein Tsubulata_024019 [Turnera subulata]
MASSSGSCGEPKPLQGLAGIIRSLDGWSLSGWRKVELIRLGRRPCSEHLNAACWASHTSQEENLFVRNHPIFEGSPSTKGGGEDNFASPDRDGDSDGGAEGAEEEDLNWGCSEEEEDLNWGCSREEEDLNWGCSEEEEDLNWGCCAEEEEDSGWGCSEEEDDRVWGWCSEDSGSDAAEGKDAESEDDEVFDFFGSRRQQLSQRFPEQDLEEIDRYVDRANFIYNGW